jgi:hypothetical protein
VRYAVVASSGVWRSLVARFVRDEEAVGSNPATPTSSAAGIQPVYTFPLRFVVSVGLYARRRLG